MNSQQSKLIRQGVTPEDAAALVEAGLGLPADIKAASDAALTRAGLSKSKRDALKVKFHKPKAEE